MQSAEIDPKMTQIIKLADKNFKPDIINVYVSRIKEKVIVSKKMRNLEGKCKLFIIKPKQILQN